MTNRSNTKEIIAKAFRKAVAEDSSSKISVQAISEQSGISRKTFYYHFFDRLELIQWIFRSELGELLINQCAAEDLIYLQLGTRINFPEIPYFARTPIGIRSLDGSEFFRILGGYLQENRSFYRQIITSNMFSGLLRYILKLYQQAFINDIRFVLGGRSLPQETISQLAMYFSNTALFNYFESLMFSSRDLTQLLPEEFANINHELLAETIDGYFSQNKNKYSFFSFNTRATST
ncbi:MAG: hypothetical protein LBK67_00390 [Coriobacteriales bacterium]|jgi:AcrR family transcriptional regulator|nr:hypothetical protein [Coriobacteriales bacterium]